MQGCSRPLAGSSTGVAAHDPALALINDSLANASFAIDELGAQLSGYLASLDADGARELEAVQERRRHDRGPHPQVRSDAG